MFLNDGSLGRGGQEYPRMPAGRKKPGELTVSPTSHFLEAAVTCDLSNSKKWTKKRFPWQIKDLRREYGELP